MGLQSSPALQRRLLLLLLLLLCFAIPSANAQVSWQSMAPTTGRSGGGFLITVTGTNFVTTTGNTYRCVFTQVASPSSIVATAVAVTATSATRVVCTAPAFPGVGNAVMTLITQVGSSVVKSGAASSVFVFALPVASISGPTVFIMGDCGTPQTLSLMITWSHPTSNLFINTTRFVDIDTGAIITTASTTTYLPAKSLSVNITWTPSNLNAENVSRVLNFSVVISEVGFSPPDSVALWRQIEVQSPPEFVFPSPVPNSNVSVAVGQSFSVALTVADRNPADLLDVALADGSGLPNSATLAAVSVVSSSSPYSTSIQRVLQFTPLPSFAGLVFVVCMRAASSVVPLNGCPLCFTISIPAPFPEVALERSSPPAFISSAVNCQIRLTVSVVDRGFSTYCSIVRLVSPSNSQPAVIPAFSSFNQLSGPLSTSNPSSSCSDGSSYEFSWLPVRGQDGMSFDFCFSIASSLQPEQAVSTVCHSIKIEKCRVCVGPGDTIGSIALRYSTDWLQLWGSNFNISEPDALQQGQLMTLGPTYRTRFGDTLSSVAQLFGITADSILAVNPDVPAQESLAVDTMLCVQPRIS